MTTVTSPIALAYAIAHNLVPETAIRAILEFHPDGVLIRTPDGRQQWLGYSFTLESMTAATVGSTPEPHKDTA